MPGKDLYGDPLPAGVLVRMGTVRLRHGSSVCSVAFSTDGKTVASGSEDHTIRLWDVIVGIRNPKAHDNVEQKDPIRTLQYIGFADLLAHRVDEVAK